MEFTLERFGNELYLALKAISDSQTEYEDALYSFITKTELAKAVSCPEGLVNLLLEDLMMFGYITRSQIKQQDAYQITELGARVVRLMTKPNFLP